MTYNVFSGTLNPTHSLTHSPEKGHSPQFLAHVYRGQTAVCIRIRLGTRVGLSLGGIVLDGDPAPPPVMRHNTQFSANIRCGQTAGWTKMPRCGCRPRRRRLCVRWGPAPPSRKKRHSPHPIFRPCLLWLNGWMDEDATWYGSRPLPRPHCVSGDPATPR